MRAPLDFEFTESIGPLNRTYAVTVVPYDPGGEFSWGDGGGVPMRGGTPGVGCSCVSYDGHGVVFGCTEQCQCAGTMVWKIPIGWNAAPASPVAKEINPDQYRQRFEIFSNGTLRIDKHENWISRTIDDHIFLNGEQMK